MVKNGQITHNPLRESVGAISVGICNGKALLDLEYEEDSSAEVDANFVLTESGNIVEIQGTAEEKPFSKTAYLELMELAQEGINNLIIKQKEAIKNAKI